MLSYQHGYHAGNFADVHKHLIFSRVLDYLIQKAAPITCMDVYAGRGAYELNSTEALKTGEAAKGIQALWPATNWPELAQPYGRAISDFNADSLLKRYPGSPVLARHWLRPDDRHVLCELHPQELTALKSAMKGAKHCAIHQRDALEAIRALTPPAIRRGCVLIDPSYEQKDEFQAVAESVTEGLGRWPEASWLIWYPLLPQARHKQLLSALRGQGKRGQLISELQVRPLGAGMHGSGMLVINPPWSLVSELQSLQEWLGGLGQEGRAAHTLISEKT